VASEVRPDPLQSIAQRGGDGPDPRGLGRPSGSWVDFTVADVVATAAEAAARCRRDPDAARVVGSFPLALHDLGTFAPGLRGSPRPVRLRAEGSTLSAAIMPFASPAKTRSRLVRSVGAVSLRSGRGPSIARLRVETPLVGLSKDRPSAVQAPGVHSRYLPSGEGGHLRLVASQAPSTFRSCRFSRLQRLAPPDALQVCCTLQPAMGFVAFPAPGRDRSPGRPRRLSRGATPFGAFPSPAAAPRHRGRCPLAVRPAFRCSGPPCRHGVPARLRRSADLRALLHRSSPLLPAAVAGGGPLDAPLGLCSSPRGDVRTCCESSFRGSRILGLASEEVDPRRQTSPSPKGTGRKTGRSSPPEVRTWSRRAAANVEGNRASQNVVPSPGRYRGQCLGGRSRWGDASRNTDRSSSRGLPADPRPRTGFPPPAAAGAATTSEVGT
jgi:hypothetical protein